MSAGCPNFEDTVRYLGQSN